MSVDIQWDTITAGPDGIALAEKIREFIHFKFQQITLPRFINSVHVHSFEFGSTCPEIEIKDVCDPLPDFYEDEDESENDESGEDIQADLIPDAHHSTTTEHHVFNNMPTSDTLTRPNQPIRSNTSQTPTFPKRPPLSIEAKFRGDTQASRSLSTDNNAGPFPRSGTPGIPGGTSNLSYFHLPMGGLSGTQTPLAAVASGTPFSPGPWQHDFMHPIMSPLPRSGLHNETAQDITKFNESGTRPSTANTLPSPESASPFFPASPERSRLTGNRIEKVMDNPFTEDRASPTVSTTHSTQPSDLQVVARVKYSGDIRMTLTAEILLDYPMPSFVGIPVRLAITGMTFDGVALVAYIRKRMHFCFLDPQDAEALVGDQISTNLSADGHGRDQHKSSLTGILQEIRVESEIGKQENGKQVLKNVGKVEKFIIEQIRRIFEDEFIFPSFWTFLV